MKKSLLHIVFSLFLLFGVSTKLVVDNIFKCNIECAELEDIGENEEGEEESEEKLYSVFIMSQINIDFEEDLNWKMCFCPIENTTTGYQFLFDLPPESMS